jgi:hypothetical protein
MHRNYPFFIILSLSLMRASACSQKQKIVSETADPTQINEASSSIEIEVVEAINPNGDSELALLMRSMFDELEEAKTQIANQEPVTLELDHEKILTAHATKPEVAASDEFKGFAQAYLQSMEEFKEANSDQLVGRYTALINNCMACHEVLCPGPKVKIRKLR